MPTGSAIIAILSVFLAFWFFNMSRAPKEWRLWWLNVVGSPDLDSTREERRRHEFLLKCFSFVFTMLCMALAVSCIYFTVEGVKEMRRPKTQFEQDQYRIKKQMQEMGPNFKRLN
ncbi:hypothetical protein BH11VER1_BH11VER1_15410 [soil metagenome]